VILDMFCLPGTESSIDHSTERATALLVTDDHRAAMVRATGVRETRFKEYIFGNLKLFRMKDVT